MSGNSNARNFFACCYWIWLWQGPKQVLFFICFVLYFLVGEKENNERAPNELVLKWDVVGRGGNRAKNGLARHGLCLAWYVCLGFLARHGLCLAWYVCLGPCLAWHVCSMHGMFVPCLAWHVYSGVTCWARGTDTVFFFFTIINLVLVIKLV